MLNTMKYLDYTASVQYDDEDGLFYGDVMDLRDTITFSGASVEELQRAFRQAVDDYVEFCHGRGEDPEKPFSGRFVLRLEPSMHRKAAVAAAARQVSLNTFITGAVERELSEVGSIARGRFNWTKAQFVRRTYSVPASTGTPAQIQRTIGSKSAQSADWAELLEGGAVFGRGEKNDAA